MSRRQRGDTAHASVVRLPVVLVLAMAAGTMPPFVIPLLGTLLLDGRILTRTQLGAVMSWRTTVWAFAGAIIPLGGATSLLRAADRDAASLPTTKAPLRPDHQKISIASPGGGAGGPSAPLQPSRPDGARCVLRQHVASDVRRRRTRGGRCSDRACSWPCWACRDDDGVTGPANPERDGTCRD